MTETSKTPVGASTLSLISSTIKPIGWLYLHNTNQGDFYFELGEKESNSIHLKQYAGIAVIPINKISEIIQYTTLLLTKKSNSSNVDLNNYLNICKARHDETMRVSNLIEEALSNAHTPEEINTLVKLAEKVLCP